MNPSKNRMNVSLRFLLAASLFFCPPAARAQTTLTEQQQLARDIFRELVEINTTHGFGSTRAAEAASSL